MYPYVSGEFKPVERQKNVISYGKSGRAESGMKHKSYNFLSVFSNGITNLRESHCLSQKELADKLEMECFKPH